MASWEPAADASSSSLRRHVTTGVGGKVGAAGVTTLSSSRRRHATTGVGGKVGAVGVTTATCVLPGIAVLTDPSDLEEPSKELLEPQWCISGGTESVAEPPVDTGAGVWLPSGVRLPSGVFLLAGQTTKVLWACCGRVVTH
mmetsp:Transcript_65571/g.181790  ORF Transcript_65571/g.181790 Transcript_65571/m.181790 type:complete len:141 (+) Transcript_65571:489-911(+)